MEKNGEQTAEEIEKMGRKAIFHGNGRRGYRLPLTKMMDMARNELGGMDILVNNAGVNVHKKALDITLRISI